MGNLLARSQQREVGKLLRTVEKSFLVKVVLVEGTTCSCCHGSSVILEVLETTKLGLD